MHFRGLQKK